MAASAQTARPVLASSRPQAAWRVRALVGAQRERLRHKFGVRASRWLSLLWVVGYAAALLFVVDATPWTQATVIRRAYLQLPWLMLPAAIASAGPDPLRGSLARLARLRGALDTQLWWTELLSNWFTLVALLCTAALAIVGTAIVRASHPAELAALTLVGLRALGYGVLAGFLLAAAASAARMLAPTRPRTLLLVAIAVPLMLQPLLGHGGLMSWLADLADWAAAPALSPPGL